MSSAYVGVFPNEGKIVPEEDAFEYAKSHLDEMAECDKSEFIEWFFSGNWIKQEGEFNCKGKWKPTMDCQWT